MNEQKERKQPIITSFPLQRKMAPNDTPKHYFRQIREDQNGKITSIIRLLSVTLDNWDELTPRQMLYKIKTDKTLKYSYLNYIGIEYDEKYLKYAEAEQQYLTTIKPWLKKWRAKNE